MEKKKVVIIVTSILVTGLLVAALFKKHKDKNSDVSNDVEFQALIKKIDNAKK